MSRDVVFAVLKEILVRATDVPELGGDRTGSPYFEDPGSVLEDTPLGDEDLAPLAMHRLDALAGITVGENGLPGNIYLAHLMPDPTSDNYRLFDPRAVGRLDDDFLELIRALEQEFDRHYRRMQVADDRERAILVHVTTGRRSEAEASMDELEE